MHRLLRHTFSLQLNFIDFSYSFKLSFSHDALHLKKKKKTGTYFFMFCTFIILQILHFQILNKLPLSYDHLDFIS